MSCWCHSSSAVTSETPSWSCGADRGLWGDLELPGELLARSRGGHKGSELH